MSRRKLPTEFGTFSNYAVRYISYIVWMPGINFMFSNDIISFGETFDRTTEWIGGAHGGQQRDR